MGPLAGIRVIEVAGLAPAPFGCMILSDLGAEILRVDRYGSAAELSMPPGPLDRGRRTVALDLKKPEGVTALHKLVESADVFVEGFRPGVTERLGFGPDDLAAVNPRLVYARMTGWGQDGPMRDRAGHDINYLALSGMLHPLARTGQKPFPPGNLLADFAGGGVMMALGILAALVERQTSSQGQVVDAAMVDGASLYSAFLRGMNSVGLWNEEPGNNLLDGGAAFYDTYECADGKYVAVGCVEPKFFAQLVSTLEIDGSELPHQLDPSGMDQWRVVLADIFRTRERDEWAELFFESDACVTPVLTPWEAPAHPHHTARDSFIEIDGLVQPAPAPRFGRSQVAVPVGADASGRDYSATLQAWGFTEAQIADLVNSDVVA